MSIAEVIAHQDKLTSIVACQCKKDDNGAMGEEV
jgi:hypothetical protein